MINQARATNRLEFTKSQKLNNKKMRLTTKKKMITLLQRKLGFKLLRKHLKMCSCLKMNRVQSTLNTKNKSYLMRKRSFFQTKIVKIIAFNKRTYRTSKCKRKIKKKKTKSYTAKCPLYQMNSKSSYMKLTTSREKPWKYLIVRINIQNIMQR